MYVLLLSYSSSNPTCSRYPCWDTWSWMPETWGHCRHSCSKLHATNQPKPSRRNRLPITRQDLRHAYKPATACAELYICIWIITGQHCCVSAFGKTWISHMFWLFNAVLTSTVREAVNPAAVQKPHRNMALIYDTGEWGGGLPEEVIVVVFFFLLPAHPSPCELNSAAPLKSNRTPRFSLKPQIFPLNSSSNVNVWSTLADWLRKSH